MTTGAGILGAPRRWRRELAMVARRGTSMT
jgi:hypothetical protein